jgi:uncharacterized protein (UPF0332 family)
MIEEKKLKEGIVKTKGSPEHKAFFLKNAENSLRSAKVLLDLSTNKDYQKYTSNEGFDGSLWIINASYYSMFYTVRALLENAGINLKSDLSIHTLAFDTLVYFFYLTGKLEKKLFEVFAEAQEEATELLGKEKADSLIQEYLWEKKKRATFTYETGEFAMQNKAKTSFERAKKFNEQIRAIMD